MFLLALQLIFGFASCLEVGRTESVAVEMGVTVSLPIQPPLDQPVFVRVVWPSTTPMDCSYDMSDTHFNLTCIATGVTATWASPLKHAQVHVLLQHKWLGIPEQVWPFIGLQLILLPLAYYILQTY